MTLPDLPSRPTDRASPSTPKTLNSSTLHMNTGIPRPRQPHTTDARTSNPHHPTDQPPTISHTNTQQQYLRRMSRNRDTTLLVAIL